MGKWLGTALLMSFVVACAPKPEVVIPPGDSEYPQLDPYTQGLITLRTQDGRINQAMMGALLYLDDTQVRGRFGPQPCQYDASGGDGCLSTIQVNPPCFLGIETTPPTFIPQIVNTVGEWASYVHFLPKLMGCKGKTIVTVQDSNLFMTAAITYPLFLFKEDALPQSEQILAELRRMATANIKRYKRNDAYAFWMEFDGRTSNVRVIGPYNIPMPLIQILASTRGDPKFDWAWDPLVAGMNVPPKTWFQDLVNKKKNPYGLDAAFNIPNDADDTAVAVAIQRLHKTEHDPASGDPYYSDPANFAVDLTALDLLEKYRDVNRTKQDPRDWWTAPDTGSYMTWLKDESLDPFATPWSGVMPLAVNNVDCVVVANALFAKALNGQTNAAGFSPSIQLLDDVIAKKSWPACGLYYPQQMMFPYAASRAYRDGKISDPVLEQAMGKLLADVIQLQAADGSFPGGEDQSRDLSTALGVVTLLNIGEKTAKAAGQGAACAAALKAGVEYLLGHQQHYLLRHLDTFDRDKSQGLSVGLGRSWSSGLFFAASYWDLGQWRSKPYAVSIVLEALAKYAMAYDAGQVSIIDGRKIHVQAYARNASKGIAYTIK